MPVCGEGGGKEVRAGGHDGHVACVEIPHFGAWDGGEGCGEGGGGGAVLERGKAGGGGAAAFGDGGVVGEGAAVVVFYLWFGGDVDGSPDLAGPDCFAEDAHEEAVGQAGGAHPAEVLGAAVDFGDDADGLGEEGECATVGLGDGG